MNEHWLLIAILATGSAIGAKQPDPQPLPRVALTCPAGHHRSGGYCVPTSDKARDAMPRVGYTCPPGYRRNGAYCLATKK